MKLPRGYPMILGAAFFWGISATGAKFLLNRNLDAILLVQSRVTFTVVILLIFYFLFKRGLLVIRLKDLWHFALLGIIGIAGANVCYYITIRESTVATGILIQYTAPLVVMTYGATTRAEMLTRWKITAAVLSLAGCFLAVGAYDSSVLTITPFGMLTGVGSIVSFAFLNIYTGRVLARYNVWTVTLFSIACAAGFWMVVNPPWKVAHLEIGGETWLLLIALAVFSVLIPHTLYFAGLQYVPPSRAVITSTFEPIVAIISSALVLGELLAPLQIAGAIMVLGAIVMLQARNEAAHSPEAV